MRYLLPAVISLVFCSAVPYVQASVLNEVEQNGSFATAQTLADSAFTVNSALRQQYVDAHHSYDFNTMPTLQILGTFLGLVDNDFYAFYGRAGELLFAQTTGRSALTPNDANTDSALALYDFGGHLLFGLTSEHVPSIDAFRLPGDGMYFLGLHTTTFDSRPLTNYVLEVSRLAPVASVPEPATLLLLGTGLVMLTRVRRQ